MIIMRHCFIQAERDKSRPYAVRIIRFYVASERDKSCPYAVRNVINNA